jgi:hypothetical protein
MKTDMLWPHTAIFRGIQCENMPLAMYCIIVRVHARRAAAVKV